MSIYVIIYFLFARRRRSVSSQVVFGIVFYITMNMVIDHLREEGYQKEQKLWGFLAAILSVTFAASPMASIGQVFKTKSCDSLPFYIILSTFIVTLQWWLFGSMIGDKFVAVPNMLGCSCSLFQLSLFVIYPTTSSVPKYKKSVSEEI